MVVRESNEIPVKIPTGFVKELDKDILRGPKIVKASLKEQKKKHVCCLFVCSFVFSYFTGAFFSVFFSGSFLLPSHCIEEKFAP